MLFCFSLLKTKRQIVVENARNNIGSDDWAYGLFFGKDRLSSNGKVFFCSFEAKCNLFVYEMLLYAGIELDLPNKMGTSCSVVNTFLKNPEERPPTTRDWYIGEVDGMSLVGEGSDGIWKSMPGDIIVEYNDDTNTHHMGIISGTKKTISAASNEIIENVIP